MVSHWFHSAADFATTWLPLAFFGILVITAWLLWKTVGMMPRIRPTSVDNRARSQVTWNDVAGVEEARAELMEVVEFLRDPKRFQRLGAKVPKGLLLYGPPGTGKTLLAKAVAHESGANFYSASASSFVEMFAGLGAARIRKLFDEARKHAPAIVFIDELDAVGAQRTGHGFNREQDQTLNQLLVELDGFEGAEQVVVMGASNRIQDLDPALLRPGRFDRQMLVPPPDLSGREAILRVHARGKPLAADVDLNHTARQTSGLTGAELANICNEAAIFAGRRSDVYVTQRDFDNAIERVVAGLQQKKVLTEKERRILAYHEGGHALDGPPHGLCDGAAEGDDRVARRRARVRVLPPRGGPVPAHEGGARRPHGGRARRARRGGGRVRARHDRRRQRPREGHRDRARDGVRVGHVGERVVANRCARTTTRSRRRRSALRDSEQARLTDGAYDEALRLIQKHRAPLDRLAAALLEKETLDREEVMSVLADVEPESRASESVGVPQVVASGGSSPGV